MNGTEEVGLCANGKHPRTPENRKLTSQFNKDGTQVSVCVPCRRESSAAYERRWRWRRSEDRHLTSR